MTEAVVLTDSGGTRGSAMQRWISLVLLVVALLSTSACRQDRQEALGTLEWDIVRGRAPASEAIVEILVEEGDEVKKDQILLRLDAGKQKRRVEQLEAEHQAVSWQLKEYLAGPREEKIAELKVRLEGAETALVNARRLFERQTRLFKESYASEELRDAAESRYAQALAARDGLREQMRELETGTRREVIERSRSRLEAVEAELNRARLQLADYTITATRPGRVEHLPYVVGDRPTIHAVLVTLLVGDRPWARVYIPETHHALISAETEYPIAIDGTDQGFTGRLRRLASRPTFTPYYALSERDRSRLVYVGEFILTDPEARALKAGTPVQLRLEAR